MNDESKSTSISLVNIDLPDFVNNAAKNLTDKPTQSIGQTFSDLWQLVFGGRISLAVEKQKLKYALSLEEYRNRLETKITAIPEEKQIEPSIQIAAQALEDSKYCVESQELREMFTSLIANSMNIDYAAKVHPSFSKIIQQMSPLDAQMLKILARYQVNGGISIVNYRRVLKETEYTPIVEYIPEQTPDNCPPEIAARSIVSLQRLGIIQIPADGYFVSENRYTSFQNTPLYKELNRHASIYGYKLKMEKHLAKLTTLGQDFVSVCLD